MVDGASPVRAAGPVPPLRHDYLCVELNQLSLHLRKFGQKFLLSGTEAHTRGVFGFHRSLGPFIVARSGVWCVGPERNTRHMRPSCKRGKYPWAGRCTLIRYLVAADIHA